MCSVRIRPSGRCTTTCDGWIARAIPRAAWIAEVWVGAMATGTLEPAGRTCHAEPAGLTKRRGRAMAYDRFLGADCDPDCKVYHLLASVKMSRMLP